MNARVFLVDNDQVAHKQLTVFLEERGLFVESYDSGEGFLEAYVSQPGCLILDIHMPEMSGVEFQQLLADKQIKIPIIFITAYADVRTVVQALKQGAIDVIEKPYRQEILFERIQEALVRDARIRQAEIEVNTAMQRFESLTQRQREVLVLLVSGSANSSNKQIANQLDISRRTVEDHRREVMRKMGALSIANLVQLTQLCGKNKP